MRERKLLAQKIRRMCSWKETIMPSEKILRDDIVKVLATQGYISWWPGRIKFRAAQDIFTIWDLIAAKKNEIKFIQFTTKSNLSSHVKKINDYRTLYDLSHKGEIWCWNGKTRQWEITYI